MDVDIRFDPLRDLRVARRWALLGIAVAVIALVPVYALLLGLSLSGTLFVLAPGGLAALAGIEAAGRQARRTLAARPRCRGRLAHGRWTTAGTSGRPGPARGLAEAGAQPRAGRWPYVARTSTGQTVDAALDHRRFMVRRRLQQRARRLRPALQPWAFGGCAGYRGCYGQRAGPGPEAVNSAWRGAWPRPGQLPSLRGTASTRPAPPSAQPNEERFPLDGLPRAAHPPHVHHDGCRDAAGGGRDAGPREHARQARRQHRKGGLTSEQPRCRPRQHLPRRRVQAAPRTRFGLDR